MRHVGGRQVLVAVKADAYGHGAIEVSRLLERTGAADWLGVATVDEGVQLREAGIGLPILKLSMARGDEVAAAVAADLSLVVVDGRLDQRGLGLRPSPRARRSASS